jgi:transporter family-2 protein
MQAGMYILFAFLVGIISSIHMPMNATVGKHVGSPLAASILFYLVAFLSSLIIFLIVGNPETLQKLKSIPPYLFLTGIISAFVVVSFTFLLPILGARQMAVLSIAGSIITALFLSHFGLLSSPVEPITLKKGIGAAVLLAGVIISIT